MSNSENEAISDFDVEEIYTPLEVAKEEIWRRWNDKELRKKVDDFFGEGILKILKEEPRAVMVRQVASPNMEFHRFLDLAKLSKLKPLVNEYASDKFVSINSYKLSLGKLSFFEKLDKRECPIVNNIKIINIDDSENKEFSNINTINGDKLIDFHHKMLNFDIPGFSMENLVDISNWCGKNGGKASDYYHNFLAWFICNGILFENFLTHKNESNFTKKVVLPAFKRVEERFGLKPLIVPIVKNNEAEDIFWRSYHKEIEKNFFIKK